MKNWEKIEKNRASRLKNLQKEDNCKVKIPSEGGKITVKTINGTPYVYYETSIAVSN